MEFTHGRSDNRFYAEEEDEEEGGRYVRPFLSITSSGPISEPSTSAAPPATVVLPVEKEHMFEKVVTPSDVGKLNRLVIPKQHAEKYFPLDASTHDRGLLLNFEDRNGKPWRFRYSYWNSSQSYVMTKGWSRFVKEKHLDAGDTVSFGRGTGGTAAHLLFIDWKRRPDPTHLNPPNTTLRIPRFPSPSSAHPHPYLSFSRSASAPWAASRLFVPHAAAPSTPAPNYFYFRSASTLASQPNPCSTAFDPPGPIVLDSTPVAHGKAAAEPKRVRIFGVNLEQPPLEAADTTKSSASLLGLKLRSPFPSQDLRPGSESSSAASSSSSTKGAHPSFASI